MLCSIGNLWAAASSVIPSSPSYKDISAAVTDNEYVFECLSSSITSTANATSSWIGWYSTQSSFKEYDKSGSAVCMGTQKKIPNLKYDKVYFYVTKCDSFQIQAWANGSSRTLNYSYQAAGEDAVEGSFTESSNTDCAHSDFISLDKTKNYTIIVWNNNAEEIGVTYMVFKTAVIACTDPQASFTVDENASAMIYTNGSATLALSSSNTNAVSYSVTKDDTAISEGYSISNAGVFTVTAGAGVYVITATQAADGTHCAVEESVTVTVNEATPVTSVSIDGNTAAYVGGSVIYTATAANASAYRWKVDGVVQAGATEATFTYNATVKGSYAIVCEARNNFNEEGVWVASAAKNLVVSALHGDIVTYTMETASGNIDKDITAGGIVGATGHQKSQKNGKLGSNGHYLSFTINQGKFQVGDTVKISVTPEYNSDKGTYNFPGTLKLASDLDNTDFIGQATLTVDPSSSATVVFNIVLTKEVSTIYLSRNGTFGQNPIVASVVITRPMPEKSRSAEISSVEIDGDALDAAALTTLKSDHSFAATVEFAEAPVVKFYTTVTVTYEDDSQKVLNDSVVVMAVEDADTWKAQAEIDEVTYTVTAVHPVSFTVNYIYGETILGEEAVIAGGNPAKYASHQSMQLATFDGWYSDAELTNAVTIASAEIVQDTTFYAKFTLQFATSINIEQLVLDNGKGYDLMAQMGTLHYSSNLANDLDSLNDTKTKRNEPYLGQKAKAAGKLLDFRVAANSTVKVKFGNVGATPQVKINDGAYADMVITEGVYTYTAEENVYLSITTISGSTVVFKQIMIDEDIQDVELPVSDQFTLGINGYSTYANNFKYTVTGATVYKAALNTQNDAVVLTEVSGVIPANAGVILKGEEDATVTILAKPDDSAITLTDNALVGVTAAIEEFAVANAYVIATQVDEGETEATTKFYPYTGASFPAHKAYMVITPAQQGAPIRIVFAEETTTDINNLEATDKAVKFFENGNLYILREGVVYDATGRVVR